MTLLVRIPVSTAFDNPLKAIKYHSEEANIFLEWVEKNNIQLVINQDFNSQTGKIFVTAEADLTGIKDSKATYWALKLVK